MSATAAILTALARPNPPVGFTGIARATGFTPRHVKRVVAELLARGEIEVDVHGGGACPTKYLSREGLIGDAMRALVDSLEGYAGWHFASNPTRSHDTWAEEQLERVGVENATWAGSLTVEGPARRLVCDYPPWYRDFSQGWRVQKRSLRSAVDSPRSRHQSEVRSALRDVALDILEHGARRMVEVRGDEWSGSEGYRKVEHFGAAVAVAYPEPHPLFTRERCQREIYAAFWATLSTMHRHAEATPF